MHNATACSGHGAAMQGAKYTTISMHSPSCYTSAHPLHPLLVHNDKIQIPLYPLLTLHSPAAGDDAGTWRVQR